MLLRFSVSTALGQQALGEKKRIAWARPRKASIAEQGTFLAHPRAHRWHHRAPRDSVRELASAQTTMRATLAELCSSVSISRLEPAMPKHNDLQQWVAFWVVLGRPQ